MKKLIIYIFILGFLFNPLAYAANNIRQDKSLNLQFVIDLTSLKPGNVHNNVGIFLHAKGLNSVSGHIGKVWGSRPNVIVGGGFVFDTEGNGDLNDNFSNVTFTVGPAYMFNTNDRVPEHIQAYTRLTLGLNAVKDTEMVFDYRNYGRINNRGEQFVGFGYRVEDRENVFQNPYVQNNIGSGEGGSGVTDHNVPDIPITNHNVPVTDHNVPVTDHNVPVTNHNVPITNHNVPVTNHNVPVTNHNVPDVPITNHNVPHHEEHHDLPRRHHEEHHDNEEDYD